MKYFGIIFLTAAGGFLLCFSGEARQGAAEGLALAQNTVVPSLLPLLIIMLLIMKSGGGKLGARLIGNPFSRIFRLPAIAAPAVLFGMLGGYPTGALLTKELFERDDIDAAQARALLAFNFCGGCGFIITAVGAATLGSVKSGVILWLSNVLSALLVGVLGSFKREYRLEPALELCAEENAGDALISAVDSAMRSVLNITAFIVLFSAFTGVFSANPYVSPLLEITSGICGGRRFPLPLASAYLAFGGLCIHLQLLPIIGSVKLKYPLFLFFRVLCAAFSFFITKCLLLIFPSAVAAFSDSASSPARLSSVNAPLSALMVFGCFVFILDLKGRKSPIC